MVENDKMDSETAFCTKGIKDILDNFANENRPHIDIMKKRIIFYFSATGNSLYVANQLKSADGEALSIPQLMKNGEFDFEAEEIGFVYPIYMHIPPFMVQQFIAMANLKADYFFAVPTYGARAPMVSEIWQNIAEKAVDTRRGEG